MAENILKVTFERLREKGLADARALSAQAISGKADGTALIAAEDRIPTWRPRSYNGTDTPVGKPYKWQGQVYTLWQQHDAAGQADWSPDKAVSLWNICHTTDPTLAKVYVAPQGSRGLWQGGECCVQNGHVWKNLTDNHAYGPHEVPSGWEDLGPVSEVQA